MNTIMQNVKNFINGPQAPKSVDSIMATFNDTITQLEDLQRDRMNEARRYVEIISAAQESERVAVEEANRAKAVAGKLKAIVA